MRHLDEGTIHSWLDGALSPDEAVSVAAHVASCKQCADAVAEARGLIAVSSRILGALDAVPDHVIPNQVIPKKDHRSGKAWYRRPSFQSAIGLAAAAVGVFWVVNQAPVQNELSHDSTGGITHDTSVVSRNVADTPTVAAAPLAYGDRSTESTSEAFSAAAKKTANSSATFQRERANTQAREKRAVVARVQDPDAAVKDSARDVSGRQTVVPKSRTVPTAPVVSDNTTYPSVLPPPKVDTTNKAHSMSYFEMAVATPRLVYFAMCDTLEVKVYDVEPNGRATLTIRDRTPTSVERRSLSGVSKGVMGAGRASTDAARAKHDTSTLESNVSVPATSRKMNLQSKSKGVIAESRVALLSIPKSCAEALSQYSPSDTTVSVLRWSDSTNLRNYVLKSTMPLQSLNLLRGQLQRSLKSDR